MSVVSEEAAFVSENGGLDDDDGWWGWFVFQGKGFGDLGEEGFFEIALFADDGADEGVVVFEEGVGLGGAA